MLGTMGIIRQAARPTPSWMQPGAAFHIQPVSGWAWINGQEFTSFANLINTPSAASFSRASEAYGLTSAGTFTRFDSGVPAITDLGLLVEGEETGLMGNCIDPVSWSATGVGATLIAGQQGPFGATAIKLTAGVLSGTHYLTTGPAHSFTSGTPYLCYFIVEQLSAGFVQISGGSAAFGTQTYANFDLAGDGTVGTRGSNTTSSGMKKLSDGRFIVWMIAPATITASTSMVAAFANSNSAARLPSHSSAATMVISARQVSEATRWGSPIATPNADTTITREAVALNVKPPTDTYNITVKYGDGTVDQVFSGQVVSGPGWNLPVGSLNGRFVTDIIGVAV